MTHSKLQLEPGEIVLTQVRKHWFVLVAQLFGILVGALAPVLLLLGYGLFFTETLAQYVTFNPYIFTTLYSGWLLMMWMVAFQIWTDYYLDVWTITNVRIIAIDQKGFFSRTMASFRLDRLQDVSAGVHGLIPTLLDFGTLEAQTAGEAQNFKAFGLPHPGDLKTIILEAADKQMHGEKL